VRTSFTVVVPLLLAAVGSASPGPAPAPSPAAAASTSAAPATAAPPAPAYYRIELAPSGSYVAIGTPVTKATGIVFHAYPDGKLMSLRKSDVKKVSAITAQEAAGPANKDLVSIGNLAMQGGSAPAASGGARAAGQPGSYGGAIVHGPQGAAMIPTRDGIAVTTDAAHAGARGPSVVNVPDGVAVSTAPPKQ
jgi:hypothetical protein